METFKTEDETFFSSYISTTVLDSGVTQLDRTWMLPSGSPGAAEVKMETRMFLLIKE